MSCTTDERYSFKDLSERAKSGSEMKIGSGAEESTSAFCAQSPTKYLSKIVFPVPGPPRTTIERFEVFFRASSAFPAITTGGICRVWSGDRRLLEKTRRSSPLYLSSPKRVRRSSRVRSSGAKGSRRSLRG